MLGTLLGAGVPSCSLERSRGSHRQPDPCRCRVHLHRTVRKGRDWVKLRLSRVVSRLVLEMVSVARKADGGYRISAHRQRYEGDLDRQLKDAVAFAEPLMLFFIAGFIGLIFIGMLLRSSLHNT